uniref:EF-hand domain family, member B n=1 Tax=Kryptolebias marmoratus TaxID=37003 RepID=A0A3Q3AC47_KRYMA
RSPKTSLAGKLKPIGDSVKDCIQEMPSPQTPPAVRRVRSSNRPEPGAVRVHRGKAGDPDVASCLVHGVRTKASLTEERLFNPPPKTVLQQKLQELRESVYASNKNAPLGRSHDQHAALPSWYDDRTTFGVKTIQGQGVRDLINPPETTEEMEKDAEEGHDGSSCSVGQQTDRRSTWSLRSKDGTFGIRTPHFSDGRNLRKSLRWAGEPLNLCRRKNTSHLPPEHTFGRVLPPNPYGRFICVFCNKTHNGTERDGRSDPVSAVRLHLKKINFRNFPSLLKAFQHYDKEGKGAINKDDLRAACQRFQLDVSEAVLDDLVDFCDADKDGLISFLEFANFLNWKDKMPISSRDQRVLTAERLASSDPDTDRKPEPSEPLYPRALIKPEDLEPVHPGSLRKTLRTLRKPRAAPDHFLTSASAIGATAAGVSGTNMSQVGDTNNYGDSSTAADLLNPSVSAARGVHEQHFLCPRSKHEISEIFRNVGVNISEETFKEAWRLASMKQPGGEVCVEVFRNALREIKAM